MTTQQTLLVTALPHSADPTPAAAGGERFHVSLFFTHQLTPNSGEGQLDEFPAVATWVDTLRTAAVRLFGSGGEIAVTPLLDDLDPELWRAVFPEHLLVRGWRTPDRTDRPWRTFPASWTQFWALGVHALSMFASPTASPGVKQSPLVKPVIDALGQRRVTLETLVDPQSTMDADTTAALDELAASIAKPAVGGSISGPPKAPTALDRMLAGVHQARRYYQRPEEQRDYRKSPLPGATLARPAPPEFDFHERAAALGDLPLLLRRLGLVIDLIVDDVSQLAAQEWIRGQLDFPSTLHPAFTPAPAQQARTRCQVSGHRFYPVSASGDWTRGALRIGDADRFVVLDLDPDASALKLEQFLRSMARLKAMDDNKDPVTAAPPTLRASGFSVARAERAAELHTRLAKLPALNVDLATGASPALGAEELTRGLRVEVWDDVSRRWHSLHRRRLDVEVVGYGSALSSSSDEGFLQGASLTKADVPGRDTTDAPYNAHEVIAGWDGWSLSAPRPGPTLVHLPSGEEVITDDPAGSVTGTPTALGPVSSHAVVEPGSLPRLRYGRTYALRLWAVDLAGNCTDRAPGPDWTRQESTPEPPLIGAGRGTTVSSLPHAAVPMEFRAELSQLRRRRETPFADRAAGSLLSAELAGELSLTGVPEVDRLVVDHLTAVRERMVRTRAGEPEAGSRLAEVVDAFDAMALSEASLLEDAVVAPETFGVADILTADGTVGPPKPFLRWDPVLEPTVVTRQPFTEGESLLNVVLRSGVTQDSDSGDVTVTPPAAFVAATEAAHPELDLRWRADSQRHLAAPKASQWQCEVHGMFDSAIGSSDPVAQRAALQLAVREAGTFLDLVTPEVVKSDGSPTQYLAHSPTVAPESLLTLAEVQDRERRAALPAGQYIVHDVDELKLPYLPDPAAGGICMVFPDAGRGHHHPERSLTRVEAMQQDFQGEWPDLEPFRLVCESGPELAAEVAGRAIRVTLPPGRQLRFRLSSSLTEETLDLFGLWRWLPAALRNNTAVASAARDGWCWWLTPAAEVTLVHAVPRPVMAPRLTVLKPVRGAGSTSTVLAGAVLLDGPSTQRVELEAAWQECLDDVAQPAPQQVSTTAVPVVAEVGYDDDLVVFAGTDRVADLPGQDSIRLHRSVHEFGDTKHRLIGYRSRATTRYREYFPREVLPTPEAMSVVGEQVQVSVPASARPAPPVVRDILPLFRWSETVEPAQPFGRRRARRSGLRLLLQRPWFSSGDGEQLAVLISTGDAATDEWVSHWAGDPVFRQGGPQRQRLLPLMDVQHLFGLDDRVDSASPVGPPAKVALPGLPSSPQVWAVPYTPVYDPERQCWVVDVAFDPGTAFWPFVTLAVARYQPHSLRGLELSSVVRCDFVQLAPERLATIARPDANSVRVVVTGPVGLPKWPNAPGFVAAVTTPTPLEQLLGTRTVTARLEYLDPRIGTDLGWRTVAKQDLSVAGNENWSVTWCGSLDLPLKQFPDGLPPATPGSSPDWRVTVEEWERLPADPDPTADTEAEQNGWQSRLIYADHLPL